jgi:hypothetical protein
MEAQVTRPAQASHYFRPQLPGRHPFDEFHALRVPCPARGVLLGRPLPLPLSLFLPVILPCWARPSLFAGD